MYKRLVKSLSKHCHPSFLIIGAQRCGTTSLYSYLVNHPNLKGAKRKEIHFFDRHYDKGLHWYLSFFPEKVSNLLITGEATPNYLFWPEIPKRVRSLFPDIKLIVLLRNPIDRAYSQWKMRNERASLKFSFEEGITSELKSPLRIEGRDKLKGLNREFTFIRRGIYFEQLKNWRKYFTEKQFFIIQSEQMFQDPYRIYQNLLDFLELPGWKISEFSKLNQTSNRKINPDTREKLIAIFKPYNEELYQLLGCRFNWDS